MVRNYVRRTNHNTYDVATIISALKALKGSKKSIREVAREYNMKMSALGYHWRRHNKENVDIEENVLKKRYTLRVFSNALEKELLSYVIMCAEVYMTVGATWIRQLAYELALENKVSVPGNWKKCKIAGKDWFLKFKKRMSQPLLQRIPESTSLEQIMGTHRNRGNFFNRNYANALAKHKFRAKDVFILEQCKLNSNGPSTDDNNQTKTPRGKSLVTFVGTVSGIGQSIPPFYIFSYTGHQDHPLLLEAPKGSIAKSDPTGTMTKRIFLDYLQHVVDYIGCNVDNPVLLLIDDHHYHFSLCTLKFAKTNGILILTFPPRTKNKVQLLERSLYSHLKTEFDHEVKIESEITIDDKKFAIDQL